MNSTESTAWQIYGQPIWAEDVADMIWLATLIEDEPALPTTKPLPSEQPTTDTTSEIQHKIDQQLPVVSPDKVETKHLENAEGDKLEEQSLPIMPEEQEVVSTEVRDPNLYLPSYGTDSISLGSAVPFFAPGVAALPDKLALGRSLRPLMQRVPDATRFVVDERATAQRTAETDNQLTLVQRPMVRRWLDVALVVEESPSMAMWHSTLEEFVELIQQVGVFRTVRSWGLAPDNVQSVATYRLQLHTTQGAGRKAGRDSAPEELFDSRGQRLIIVATDCCSLAWENGEAAKLLNLWASRGPVTILQMLPRSMWPHTALASELDVTLRASLPAGLHRWLHVSQWPYYWNIDTINDSNPLAGINPIPVITLESNVVQNWARLVAGYSDARVFGYYFLPQEDLVQEELSQERNEVPFSLYPVTISPDIEAVTEIDVEASFDAIWRHLSPSARELAAYLAAGPISFPVIRLIQNTMQGKRSRQVHVAELMYSGLFKRISLYNPTQHPDDIYYDFIHGNRMRELWLDTLPREAVETVFEKVTEYVNAQAGRRYDIYSYLYDASATIDIEQLDVTGRLFASIAQVVLRNLGGVYVEIARQITSRDRNTNLSNPLVELRPPNRIIFANLRDILARLYEYSMSARRIVDDAGLNSSHIHFSVQPINTWHSILTEATKQDQVQAILTVVLAEYGMNESLSTASATFLAGRADGNVATESPAPNGTELAKSMSKTVTLTNTCKLFSILYHNKENIRRVIDDAGIDSAYINFTVEIVDCWHEILERAITFNQVKALFEIILRQYATNSIVSEACTKFSRALEKGSQLSPSEEFIASWEAVSPSEQQEAADLFLNLCELLAVISENVATVHRMASDAGLDMTQIDCYCNRAVDICYYVLREAVLAGMVDNFLAVIIAEYNDNNELHTLSTQFKNILKERNGLLTNEEMPTPRRPAFKRLLFDNPEHFAELRNLLVELLGKEWPWERELYSLYQASGLKPGYFWEGGSLRIIGHSMLAEAIGSDVAQILIDEVLVRYEGSRLRRFVEEKGLPKPIENDSGLKAPQPIPTDMNDRVKLRTLRTTLTELYDTEFEAIRVAADAGIDHRDLSLDTSSINRWHTILQQTIKQGLLETLINIVRKDYPARLVQFEKGYALFSGKGSLTIESAEKFM